MYWLLQTVLVTLYGGPAAAVRQCHLNNIHFYYYYYYYYLLYTMLIDIAHLYLNKVHFRLNK